MNPFKRWPIAGLAVIVLLATATTSVASEASCNRGDLFKMDKLSSGLMGKAAHLYGSWPECTGLDPRCLSTITAANGHEVIVVKREAIRTCVALNSDDVGWVESSAVGPGTSARPVSDAVVGTWTQGLATLVITDEGGRLMISGHATDGRDHFGKIASELSASGDTYAWQNGCSGRVQQVGTRLVVTDDHACGGLNVNFDGVYRRQ